MQITLMKEKREKEAQLIDVGLAYQRAIASYYSNSPGTSKTYPATLAVLLMDDRTTTLRRHLRKLYPDPMTGGEWGVLRTDDGAIRGVVSLSTRVPVKKAGFPDGLVAPMDATKYSDWQFLYLPN